MTSDPGGERTAPRTEVADLLRDLIRIDTSNGEQTERQAAEWVATRLDEAGVSSRIIEAAPGRASVVARIPGRDPGRAPLLVHGHLDVVPAVAADWQVHPFSGEIVDGSVWGRGAVDMKNMDAMVLTVVREWARQGRQPERDIVLAFVADEEAGGVFGSRHLVANHPDLFADCTEAIGEVGGFSYSVREDARLYLLQTAEKGLSWLRLRATGSAGHGSMIHPDNAVTVLAAAVARVGAHPFPAVARPETEALAAAMSAVLGRRLDPQDPQQWLPLLGGLARMVGAATRNTVNPTGFRAGYQHNVIPGLAEATLDLRFLPGEGEQLLADVHELLGEQIEVEHVVDGIAVEASFDGDLVDAMCAALREEDPQGIPVPYLLSGGTDAKAFSTLAMDCYGFVPLRLPPELDFSALFHGVDERVPIDSLEFGVRVLDRLLSRC